MQEEYWMASAIISLLGKGALVWARALAICLWVWFVGVANRIIRCTWLFKGHIIPSSLSLSHYCEVSVAI